MDRLLERLISVQATVERHYLSVAKKYIKTKKTNRLEIDGICFYVINEFDPMDIKPVLARFIRIGDVLPTIAVYPDKKSMESNDKGIIEGVNLMISQNVEPTISLIESIENQLNS